MSLLRTPRLATLDERLAVRIDGLSKIYHPDAKRLHQTPISLSDRLLGRRTAEAEDVEEDDAVPEEEVFEGGDVFELEEAPTEFVWGLREATLELPRGEAVAVVGPPRSGKTTLLNLLGGTAPPSAGRIAVRGRIWPPLTYLTTFMEQGVTVRQNMRIAAKVANVPAKVVDRRLNEVYELLEITPETALRATGNRVRAVALATGFAADADLMLLDDPAVFGGQAFEEAALERLRALRDTGTTILIEEPDHQLIDALCDRVIWLEGNRVHSVGPTSAVLPDYVISSVKSSRFPQLAWRASPKTELRSFTESVAILSARAENLSALPVEVVGADDTLVVQIVLELAEAPTGVRCGLALVDDERGERYWIEQPGAITVQSTGVHLLYANVRAEQLPPGAYTVHVEAIVSRNRVDATIGRADLFTVHVHGTAPRPTDEPGAWAPATAEWRLSEPVRR